MSILRRRVLDYGTRLHRLCKRTRTLCHLTRCSRTAAVESPTASPYSESATQLTHAMYIRTPKSWQLPESAATDEKFYRPASRRRFLRAVGMGLGTGPRLASPGRQVNSSA